MSRLLLKRLLQDAAIVLLGLGVGACCVWSAL